jgi:Fic family protein
MMNETISKRQQQILEILAKYGELNRQQIAHKLTPHYDLAKATLSRDLKFLSEKKLVNATHAGPQTAYQLVTTHPHLQYLDLEQYFTTEPDERVLTKQSNDQFFTNLANHDLLNQAQINQLNQENNVFINRLAQIEPGIYQKELERFTIELTWKSAKIEGNTYSLLETEDLLKNNQPAPGHSQIETQMLLNHKTALQTIYQHRLTFSKIELVDILNIQQILVTNLAIEPGLRRQGVGITGTNYRPLSNQWQLQESLQQVIDLANQKSHPLEKALLISGLLIYLQPFVDGNKRTARLISNAVLLAHNFAALSYRSVDEIKYKQAVLLLDEQHNFYWYQKMFLEQFYFSIQQYFNQS